ncbi:hypothetical protein JTB14_017890 [Gonioctena quinquepunctata]|nr:hypothetical protein JTB14_017890 [Gonioctena quinquepunctata]
MDSLNRKNTENTENKVEDDLGESVSARNIFSFEQNSNNNRIPDDKPKSPSVQGNGSEMNEEVVLRPCTANGEKKRIVSATFEPPRTGQIPRRNYSSNDLQNMKYSKNGTKKNKNDNMVLRLVFPEEHLNNSYNNSNYSTVNSVNDIRGNLHKRQTYSISSQNDYATPNGVGHINHAFSVGDYDYPRTPGGHSIPATPLPSTVIPDDPTPRDDKKRAFSDILTKTLSLFYALFNVTIGLAVYVADIVDGSHPTPEIFSLILVVIAGLYILFLTVHISIFMHKKRKYEDLIEKEMPEEVEMSKTADGQYQFNIVVPKIIEMGKSIKHDYCFNKDRHSTNFFLKVGAAAFCFGHLIHSGLLLGYQIVFLTADENQFYECASITTLILDFIYPFYSFLLLFFIFKYSNVIINRNIIFARFGVMHCLSSSICFWVWTIFREVLEAIDAKSYHSDYESPEERAGNISELPFELYELPMSKMDAQSSNFSPRRFTQICDYRDESIKAIYRDVSPYLYPFSVEYSILVVGVLYLVWQNIGLCEVEDENEASTSQCRTPDGNPDNTESNVVVHVDCQSSNKGLFAGFVVLIFTIVCCILYFIAVYLDDGKRAELGKTLSIGTTLAILTIMIFACLFGYYQITRLDLNSAHHNLLDDVLLFICIPAFFLNGVFSIIPAIIYNNILAYITLIVEIIQVLMQTVFILDGVRRSSNTRKLRKWKPGRELVTFLVLSNIALWLMQTFDVKAPGVRDDRYEYYGKELWTIFGHLCLPLMMFYRFHSSVCFGDIWRYAYERSGH